MSFRDFTPRSNQQQQQQQCTPLKKGPLRRTTSNTYTGTLASSQRQQQQQRRRHDSLPLTRSRSDLISYDHNQYYQNRDGDADLVAACGSSGGMQSQHHRLLIQQREEEYALRVMQQREEELRDINRKMHVVDEIYKDLGEIVGQQQETIDGLEDQFERTEESTRRGLEQLEKANKKYDRRKQKKGIGGGDNSGDDEGLEDRKDQFFLLAYFSKKASEIARLISVCGGSGSVDYVHGECCRNP